MSFQSELGESQGTLLSMNLKFLVSIYDISWSEPCDYNNEKN